MIWNDVGKPYPSSYAIPGPRPFTCPAGGQVSAEATAAISSSKATTMVTSVVKPKTSTVAAPITSSVVAIPTKAANVDTGAGGVPLYGQCGGRGYTGPTSCTQGTCKESNEWYSQCVL